MSEGGAEDGTVLDGSSTSQLETIASPLHNIMKHYSATLQDNYLFNQLDILQTRLNLFSIDDSTDRIGVGSVPLCIQSHATGARQLLAFLVHLSSNGMLEPRRDESFSYLIEGLQDVDPISDFLTFLIDHDQRWILSVVLTIKSPAVKMFAGKALSVAVRLQDIRIVRLLIGSETPLNMTLKSRKKGGVEVQATPLHEALRQRHKPLIKILLEAGADVNGCYMNSFGITETPLTRFLQICCKKGHATDIDIEIVHMLLTWGAELHPTDTGLLTPLQHAICINNKELVQLILRYDHNINLSRGPGYPSSIQIAAYANNFELVRFMFLGGANINCPAIVTGNRVGGVFKLGSPLQSAVAYQNLEMINFLLENDAEFEGSTVEMMAGEHGILRHGICCYDCFTQPALSTPLSEAIKRENMEIISLLLSAGASLNHDCKPALPFAALTGNTTLCRALIQKGADPNISTRDEWLETLTGSWEFIEAEHRPMTSLQAAAASGSVELVRILLEAKADVNAPATEPSGYTALQMAVRHEHDEITSLLLRHSANVNADASNFGDSALTLAIKKSNTRLTKIFLEMGADPDYMPTRYGSLTPLQHAVRSQQLDIVQSLVNAGACLNIISDTLPVLSQYYLTGAALPLTILYGLLEIQDYLLRSGARFMLADLLTAVHTNDISMVRLVLDKRKEQSSPFSSNELGLVLGHAISGVDCKLEIVNLLLLDGADIHRGSSSCKSPLAMAIMKGFEDAIDLLLTQEPNLAWTFKGQEPLVALAAKKNDIGLVRRLVSLGADVNACSMGEFPAETPLYHACWNDNIELVELLIEHGAFIDGIPGESSPLQGAAASRHPSGLAIAALLIGKGAKVHSQHDVCGFTALVSAARKEKLDMVQLLLDNSTDAEERREDCQLALKKARTEHNNMVIFEMLEQHI